MKARSKMNGIAKDELPDWQREAFGEISIRERACPLCGDANAGTPPGRYSMGIWTIKTCRSCDFTYLDKAPDYEALFRKMSWEKTTRLEEKWRNSTRTIQQIVSKKTRWRLHLLPRKRMPDLLIRHAGSGNVIDLGCGDGGQLQGLDDSFVPYGIEISAQSATKAVPWFSAKGGRVINAPCLDGLKQFPEAFFSAATLRSYLEHELHPAEVLHELHRTLRSGGVAIVKVPNFDSVNRRVVGRRWCGFRHPDHLNYFTPHSLRLMARNCGYRVSSGLTYRLPTSDNMYAVLTKP